MEVVNIPTIRVDFTSENILPDGNVFGKTGEHNATVLEITPPAEMNENENIALYCVAFEVGRDFVKTVVRSEMIAKADKISVSLWQQTTVGERVKFQLEAYDGENNLLVKSQLIEGVFLPSVNGVQGTGDYGCNGLAASVAANTIARHTHENADVLENLADDNGTLKYNGKPIGGVTALKSKTYTVGVDGDITTSVTGFANIEFYISEPLENALLVDIRFTYNGEEVGTADFLLNGAISGQDILEIFPIAKNDYGMVARIVSNSGNASELAIQIESYQQPITAFTLYYLETNA